MHIDKVRLLPPFERLVYWIKEREKIRLLKEAGEPKDSWTDDEILSTYRFCNCRRMDDRVSRWLYDNWFKPYFNHSNMLYAVALARFINKPSSLELITEEVFRAGKLPNWSNVKQILRRHRDRGNVVFGAAYMIRGNEGNDKIECITDYYVKPLSRKNVVEINPTSMEESWKSLQQQFGFGSFMAGQCIADLRWAIKGTWDDRMSWAPIGPGSTIGLNLVAKRNPITKPWKQTAFVTFLISVAERAKSHLPSQIYNRLELHDWQNVMCEFRAYDKALYGYGTPKRLYR